MTIPKVAFEEEAAPPEKPPPVEEVNQNSSDNEQTGDCSNRVDSSSCAEHDAAATKNHDPFHQYLKRNTSSFLKENLALVPLYRPPRQRHRWGEHQHHPHKNWGDIYLDLFFVAAAYNLGNVLREDPTLTGLLYLMGCFWPIQNLWMSKLVRDGRFHYHSSLYEAAYNTAIFLSLASAVLHIRPVPIMSQPSVYSDMFVFSLSISVSYLLSAVSHLEIIYCQYFLPENQPQDDGSPVSLEPGAFHAALSGLKTSLIPLAMNLIATVYTASKYFSPHSSNYKAQQSEYSSENTTAYHRVLAGGSSSSSTHYEEDNVAIYLLFASSLFGIFYFLVKRIIMDILGIDTKAKSVPLNIQYAIHRYGEWTMLMLGETVLSLLIVDTVHTRDYYCVFFSGILSIILVEYLHFVSQPHDPDGHALRRSIYGALVHSTVMMIYSTALIVLGASFKMLLYEFVYEEDYAADDSSTYGYTSTDSYASNDPTNSYDNSYNATVSGYSSAAGDENHRRNLLGMLFPPVGRRGLAGASSALRFETDDRQQRIAYFFCGSMVLVWLCVDMLIWSHNGTERLLEHVEKCRSPPLLILTVAGRVALWVWFATVFQYVTEPRLLSFLALAGLVGQLALRGVAFHLCPENLHHQEEEKEAMELEYTQARLRQAEPPSS